MTLIRSTSVAITGFFLFSTFAFSQSVQTGSDQTSGTQNQSPQRRRPRTPTKAPVAGQKLPGGPPTMGGFGQSNGPQAYDKVITSDAKTQKGMFWVHQIKDKIYWEIPASLLNRDLFWSTELEGTPAGSGGFVVPGINAGTHLIRFEEHENKLWMRELTFEVRTNDKSELKQGLADVNIAPIIDSFDIEAFGANKSVVIDVTRLFLSDPSEFAVKDLIGGGGVDSNRSAVLKINVFPRNIETSSQLTFEGGGGRGNPFAPAGAGANTAIIHYSIDLLPKVPMQGRLGDDRVGFFSQGFTMYSNYGNEAKPETYIDRFRLVKKDPTAAISEPVKPITFYLGREVPSIWRPYLKQAVMNWEPVFEAVGFKNAITVKDAPTEKEDPNWSPEDARYSVIRWQPTETENAEGQSVHDPRSGETLSGHVVVWSNVLKLCQTWYFAQASAADPEARTLPMPTDLIGRMLTYVVTHEVGHTLGLAHNFLASSTYPTEMLRNKEFTDKYGDEASIMDYGRFNYVAQPGDNANLIPKIGPYDYFAIKYGYMPPLGDTPESEKKGLDDYLSQQVTDKTVRFGSYEGGNLGERNDPSVESEDIGDNPILASTYGLKNIDSSAGYLMSGTIVYGEPYSELEAMYRALLGQRLLELVHVTKLIGGINDTDYHSGRGGNVFVPVPATTQRQAVQFILDKGLHFPQSLLNPMVLNRVNSGDTLSSILSSQKTLLTTLFTDSRTQRMFDNEAMSDSPVYTVGEMIAQVQNSIWSELSQKYPSVSLLRRNLQSQYLYEMDDRLNGAGASPTEFRSLARMNLMHLKSAIDTEIPKTKDAETRAHFLDSSNQIKSILAGKALASAGALPDLASLLGAFTTGFEGEKVPLYIEGVTK